MILNYLFFLKSLANWLYSGIFLISSQSFSKLNNNTNKICLIQHVAYLWYKYYLLSDIPWHWIYDPTGPGGMDC